MRRALGYGILASVSVFSLGYVGTTLTACSSGDGGGPDVVDDGYDPPPTPAAWDQAVTRPDDTTATQNRAACTYKRGDMPAATLGTSMPIDKDIPITNVIVVMMENHSFDNYFGQLNKAQARTDVECPDGGDTNSITLADGGTQVAPYAHAPHLCTLDTNHEWDGTHLCWADGGMSGFAQQNEGWSAKDLPNGADPTLASGARAMFYYDQTDIPFYYALAQNFAIADHYHASVLGPTDVNRMFFWAGRSFGETTNTFPDMSAYPFPPTDSQGNYANVEATILDELEERHTNWAFYGADIPSVAVVYNVGIIKRFGRTVPHYPVYPDPKNPSVKNDFLDEAAAGTLPEMSFVDPSLLHENSDGNDEHPPADVQIGQKFVSDVVHAVLSGPQWAHTALFLTWDEHGGFYDHFAPPAACIPDSIAPILNTTSDNTIPAKFDRYGVRVPLIVVSPYAKKGYVGHTTYDHTSVLRFIEAKFKVPALTARDANADPLTDLFDFNGAPNATPATIAVPTIDPANLTYCETTYPHDGGF
jgi:phospholipase C